MQNLNTCKCRKTKNEKVLPSIEESGHIQKKHLYIYKRYYDFV